jgi:hypothetical protein
MQGIFPYLIPIVAIVALSACAFGRRRALSAFALFGAALLAGLGGCAGMSPSDNANFQAVVAKSVSPGMPFVTGIKHLVKAGFTCDERGSAPAVPCTRMRQNTLPYACIQRVDLKTDSDRKTIVEVTPEPIACAGL